MNDAHEMPETFKPIGDAAAGVIEKIAAKRPVLEWDGQPIAKPGCYRGLPLENYHGQPTAEPSISSSGLRTIFSDSPMSYWVNSPYNPNRIEPDEKPAFNLGRAVHHLALGEADFGKHFVVRPEHYPDSKTGELKPWSGASNWCKAWLQGEQDGKDRTVLTPADITAIRGMAGLLPWQEGFQDSGLANSAMVQHGRILDGLIEHSFIWQDKETGVWLRSRPDAVPMGDNVKSDLKTTVSVDFNDIEKAIGAFRYDMQAALARMAMRAVWGADLQSFALIFVEKKAPFEVRSVEIYPEDMDAAEKDLRSAIRTFARCLEKNRWPGKGGTQTDAVFVGLAPWARQRAESRRAFLEQELAA